MPDLRLFLLAGSALLAACQSAPFLPAQSSASFPQYGLINGPDGVYFTQQSGPWGSSAPSQIYRRLAGQTKIDQPAWVAPEASESDVYYSAANQTYCFTSDRAGNADIWCGQWAGGTWQPPEKMPAPLNSEANEYSPVITASGDIYFASDRPGGAGMGDLYHAQKTGTGWQVSALGSSINTPGGEWNLDLSPDGNTLVFEASHQPTNRTVSGDLYLARRGEDGWGLATPLHAINTDGSDLMPRFTGPDTFVFTSVNAGLSRYRSVTLLD